MTNLISKSFIQEVISRTDIVALVSSRIELKRRGNTHTACCPFHSEKTPSFTVSQHKQFYYCFGCGAHGDAIRFLMEYDHATFVDAITELANQLGLLVPLENNHEEAEKNNALYTQLRNAQLLYQAELKKSETAITYLKNRGVTGKIAKAFGMGFAPNAWDFLLQQLGKNKSDREALSTAGMLIEKNPGHFYDRFRDRVIFPIRDARGRTIGFGGRTLMNETPKYLNSPETPVFHKNQTLYGLYEMNQHHRKIERALVVEGYLDVISLAQHDIHYSVATLGTALNAKHIQLLLRYTSDIIFCFDGDAAGKKAAWKALTISLPLLRDGLNFRFLFLPNTEDPDSLVQKIGQNAFEKLIDQATALPTVFFDELEKTFPLDSIANKAAFAKAANELFNTMPEGIYKNLLIDQLAEKLKLTRDHVTTSSTQNKTTAPAKKPTRKLNARLNPVESAIQLLLHEPALAASVTTIPAIAISEKTAEKNVLMDFIQCFKENPAVEISELLEAIADEATRTWIAAIAIRPLHIPPAGMSKEFSDTLQCLHEQDQAHQLSALISKAKNSELGPEEKQLLQLLLAKKHAKEVSM